MAKFTYVNESAVDEELICVVCHFPLDDPVTHNPGCGHCFCRHCVSALDKCPMCCASGWNRQVPARPILNMLARLQVQCIVCSEILNRTDYEAHYANRCPVSCPLNCEARLTRSTTQAHKAECPLEGVYCTVNDVGCPWTGKRIDLAVHSSLCPFLPFTAVLRKNQQQVDQLIKQCEEQKKHITVLEEKVVRIELLEERLSLVEASVKTEIDKEIRRRQLQELSQLISEQQKKARLLYSTILYNMVKYSIVVCAACLRVYTKGDISSDSESCHPASSCIACYHKDVYGKHRYSRHIPRDLNPIITEYEEIIQKHNSLIMDSLYFYQVLQYHTKELPSLEDTQKEWELCFSTILELKKKRTDLQNSTINN